MNLITTNSKLLLICLMNVDSVLIKTMFYYAIHELKKNSTALYKSCGASFSTLNTNYKRKQSLFITWYIHVTWCLFIIYITFYFLFEVIVIVSYQLFNFVIFGKSNFKIIFFVVGYIAFRSNYSWTCWKTNFHVILWMWFMHGLQPILMSMFHILYSRLRCGVFRYWKRSHLTTNLAFRSSVCMHSKSYLFKPILMNFSTTLWSTRWCVPFWFWVNFGLSIQSKN